MRAPQPTNAPDDALSRCLVRVVDPDTPIYRIFPLWFLEEVLRLRQLVLVPPAKWEEPFEVIGQAIEVNQRRDNRFQQVISNQSLPPVFAQCWSATEESDTLLRAYSRVVRDPHFGRNTCPRDEGVRVRSSPRKLLTALQSGLPSGIKGEWFLGSVSYMPKSAIFQEIADAIGRFGHDVFSSPVNRAKLLLMKREAFAHEAELRVIFIQRDAEPSQDLLRVPVDPSAVFDEITFDPRLLTFERQERAAVMRNVWKSAVITESDLYQRTLLEVGLAEEE